MTTREAPLPTQPAADHFGRAVAARLQEGSEALPHDIRERLRAARVRAVQQRRRIAEQNQAPVLVQGGGTAALGGGERAGRWARWAAVLPLLALAAGLVLIYTAQTDARTAEIAEVDAALLTDDLPPAAYADPGFIQFLKTSRE